jgi:hypothetical protein
MSEFEFIKQGTYNIKFGFMNVSDVYYLRYKVISEKGETPYNIEEFCRKEVKKIAKHKDLVFSINANYMLNDMWRMSAWRPYDKMYAVSFDDIYEAENINIKMFDIFIRTKPKQKGGREDKNDCLHSAILQAFNYDKKMLPRNIRKASSLKKLLGLQRKDLIDIDLIPQVEALLQKASITVVGDYKYKPTELKPLNVQLKLKDGHYSCLTNSKRTMTKGISMKEILKCDIYTYYKSDEQTYKLYNGEYLIKSNKSFYEFNKGYDKILIFIDEKNDDILKSEYEAYISRAEKLKTATNGVVNYFKSMKNNLVTFESWRLFSKSLVQPEPMDEIECMIIDKAYRGGLFYIKPGTYSDAVDIDMNSMYSYYMSSSYLSLPTGKPIYKTYTQEEFNNLEYHPFGVYKCVVTGDHELFKAKLKNKYTWHSTYDLLSYKLMNLKIKIADDPNNAMLYETKQRVKGETLFKSYFDYMYDLRLKGNDTKSQLSQLHGAFAEKIKFTEMLKLNGDKCLNMENRLIRSIKHIDDNTDKIVSYSQNNIFKYDYARFCPFITSFAKYRFIKLILENVPIDDIYQINTDGMICHSKHKSKFNISNKMGDFKVKNEGKCKINNHRNITFY